jgi:plasmid stabilization system protein ParE
VARAVVWAQAAVDDLDAALEFVARASESFTATLARDAMEASRSLSQYSERGRVVPEVGHPQLRELFVRAHRMIYRVGKEEVTIVAFFHGRRDFDTVWRGRTRR